MAGASLLTLLDDIAAVLDDVAAMTKLSTQKTAGVLTDDLAVNAEQVSGVRAAREIPVVASVAKGSFINKLIIIPAILLIDHFVPWLMVILLLVGGAFLCYEGAHKIAHIFAKKRTISSNDATPLDTDIRTYNEEEIKQLEKQKIRGAIRTDFILSAEIMVIALSVMATTTLLTQVLTLLALAIIITVGVYGIVAGIVKLDDLGFYLMKKSQSPTSLYQIIGKGFVNTAPYLMKALGFIGTIAMFLVGGGIIITEIPQLITFQKILTTISAVPLSQALIPTLFSFVIGIIVGFIVLTLFNLIQRLRAL